jgi:hypothetical protein
MFKISHLKVFITRSYTNKAPKYFGIYKIHLINGFITNKYHNAYKIIILPSLIIMHAMELDMTVHVAKVSIYYIIGVI